MSEKPGAVFKFFAILGIIAYLLADIFSLQLFVIIFDDPSTFEEGLLNILSTIIFLAYALGLAIIGTVFVLIGQIWRQTKPIVTVSTLAYLVFLSPFVYLTVSDIANIEINTNFILLWASLIFVLLIHIKGLRS